jgi:hypothetical protein
MELLGEQPSLTRCELDAGEVHGDANCPQRKRSKPGATDKDDEARALSWVRKSHAASDWPFRSIEYASRAFGRVPAQVRPVRGDRDAPVRTRPPAPDLGRPSRACGDPVVSQRCVLDVGTAPKQVSRRAIAHTASEHVGRVRDGLV